MEVHYRNCAGLDVHQATVVACARGIDADGQHWQAVRTFATLTDDLLALADWLAACGCTHVAMESTGVYWKPVYNLLEGRFTLLVVNAAHVKQRAGRKTDVQDAVWLAELLQHGLLHASFIPDRAQRELRDLTRTRASLGDERTAVVNRLHKVLEDANLKLGSVVTDILGASGRAILEALLAGETAPVVLADLARGRLRQKREALERALAGRLRDHHRFLLTTHLEHLDFLEDAIARVSGEIAERLRPFEAEVARLDTIPGVDRHLAEVLVAEIGVDMTRFPTAGHLASWGGMCPGNRQSAGKRRSGKTRKGSVWLRRALTQAAQGAARTKQPGRTGPAERFRRLVRTRGKQRALVAVGHQLLVTAYHLLLRHEDYTEVVAPALDARRQQARQRRAVQQLQALGFHVHLTPATAA